MDIVNKKGFTLVEILAVIALIALVMILIVPNIARIFGNSVNTTMKIQENGIKEAALLYLEDYCKNPLKGKTCPSGITRNVDYTFTGEISLATLVSEKYIDPVKYQDTECTGTITYTNNKTSVSLTCGDLYTTQTN